MNKTEKTNKTLVLLVEDNQADARIIREYLKEDITREYEITHVERLEQGIKTFNNNLYDIVLLDLSLPDSVVLTSVIEFHGQHPLATIIVLTGLNDDETAVRAMQEGAQDYLIKSELNGKLLRRSIHCAIERQRLSVEFNETRQQRRNEQELNLLHRISGTSNTAVVSQLYGTAPLYDNMPRIFGDLVKRYGKIIDLALEQRQLKTGYDISETLREFSEELGFLKAGPRDVIRVHSIALKERADKAVSGKTHAYFEEGRFIVLELMGYLVTYYRSHSTISVNSDVLDKNKDN